MSIIERLVKKVHDWTLQWLENHDGSQCYSQGSAGWENAVLIYQPGKVGSTTFETSLLSVWNGPIVHLHSFQYEQEYPAVKKQLIKLHTSGALPKVHIITSIREPIGRNLSAFFQNLTKFNAIAFDGRPFTTEELLGLTMQSHKAQRILNWFDDELKEHFWIDVYTKKLEPEGYQLYENDKARVLLMKHDIADAKKERFIGQFLNLSNFHLQPRKNVGSTKWYADEYERCKDRGFPEWYVSQMLDSKYARHFYGDEISTLSEKWTEKETE